MGNVSGGPDPHASRGVRGDVAFCECVSAGVLGLLVVGVVLSEMSVVCLRIGLAGLRWGRGLVWGTDLGVDVALSSWRIVGLVVGFV